MEGIEGQSASRADFGTTYRYGSPTDPGNLALLMIPSEVPKIPRNYEKLKHLHVPSVSIAIPTLNEEKHIQRCLSSLCSQDYPSELVEIFIVDGGSTDKTLEIAGRYPVRIMFENRGDCDYAKMLALEKSEGDLFFYLDADNELPSKDWLSKMVYPLIEDPAIVGTFTRFIARKGDPPINRYLSYDKLQRDPVYVFFSSDIEDTIVQERDNYLVCKFTPERTPPVGLIVLRRALLVPFLDRMRKMGMHVDIDIPVLLSSMGFDKFAYVPTGIYHLHAENIQQLVRKRLRNLRKSYLTTYKDREFRWFDLTRMTGLLKVIAWVTYANLVIPAFLTALYKVFRYRDISCFYEMILTPLLTDVIVYGFLTEKRGRALLLDGLRDQLKIGAGCVSYPFQALLTTAML